MEAEINYVLNYVPLALNTNERGDEPADPALEIFKHASALSKVNTIFSQLELYFPG